MKKNFVILVLSLVSFVLNAQNSIEYQVDAALLSDGYFFDKTANMSSFMTDDATMLMMKNPEGKTLIAVYHPKGFVLADSLKSKALPVEKVKYAKELLDDYEGLNPNNLTKNKPFGVVVGKAFPAFSYKDTEGNIWSNDVLKGKVWVLNIWQKECGPCRKEMPELSTWKDKYNVVFLSASRHTADVINQIAAKHNFTWTHLQEAKSLVGLVGTGGFPLTVVVGGDGIVRYARCGATAENQAEALKVIEELL